MRPTHRPSPDWYRPLRSRRLALTLGCALAWTTGSTTQAAQFVENAYKEQVPVTISMREQNALSVQGRRLQSVIPPQPGILTSRVDAAQGVLYFRLTNPGAASVSLFATDDKGTRYQLLLNPKAVPAQDIVIKPATALSATGAMPETQARTASYQRRIKALILAMSDPSSPTRLQSVQVNQAIPLWKEGTLTFLERFADNDFIGEVYRLTNATASELTLVEQELSRPDVIAISIAQQTLAPGASTAIYVVRLRGAHEQP